MIFLLIHGAWHGSWCWDKITSNLTKAGHTVLAPDLPGRKNNTFSHSEITLQTYVDFLKKLIEGFNQKIVIVSHSFGGVIATQLANEIPDKISTLIYVCAFLPENSESLMDIAKATNHKQQPDSMIVDSSGMTISMQTSSATGLFFNCCSTNIQKWAVDQLCPEPFYPMTEKVKISDRSLANIPKTYIECTLDNALTIEAQRKMCKKHDCTTLTLHTDHSPFLSMPDELTSQLLESIKIKRASN